MRNTIANEQRNVSTGLPLAVFPPDAFSTEVFVPKKRDSRYFAQIRQELFTIFESL